MAWWRGLRWGRGIQEKCGDASGNRRDETRFFFFFLFSLFFFFFSREDFECSEPDTALRTPPAKKDCLLPAGWRTGYPRWVKRYIVLYRYRYNASCCLARCWTYWMDIEFNLCCVVYVLRRVNAWFCSFIRFGVEVTCDELLARPPEDSVDDSNLDVLESQSSLSVSSLQVKGGENS